MKVKADTGVWTFRMKYPLVQSNEEKPSSTCVRKGLVELSTIKRGSTDQANRASSHHHSLDDTQICLLRKQMRIILRILLEVKNLVEITQLCQSIAWRGRRASIASRSIIMECRCRRIEAMVHTCQCWQTKAALDEFQNRVMFVEVP